MMPSISYEFIEKCLTSHFLLLLVRFDVKCIANIFIAFLDNFRQFILKRYALTLEGNRKP